ncbi:MAG: hypothetical protein ATN35_07620 [Epulopiscium sp. Nele67-Bin004]|nr:MAG: hypothetical protein ATN35_07620 [Epulopiscium sp. Nele67-Bin004]
MQSAFTVKSLQKCSVLHAYRTIQKLSVEQWTLHTHNERHIGDVAEAMSQNSQLSKWRQGITAKGFLATPTWRL